MMPLSNEMLDTIQSQRNVYIEEQLVLCKGVQKDFDMYAIRNNYLNFLEGVAVGMGTSLSVLEDVLDKHMLGTHDTKNLVTYNDIKKLYAMIVDHRKYGPK